MKALIVEDSRLARQELKELIKSEPRITEVAEADSLTAAISKVSEMNFDVIFLDINLPDGSGFDLIDKVDDLPQIIFTTAYDEFALDAFNVSAVDYLLKPIRIEHFERAMGKISLFDEAIPAIESVEQEKLDETKKQVAFLTEKSSIFVKDNQRCWLVKISDIRYFSSSGNHVQIFFEQYKPFVYKSLSKVEARLPKHLFFRASRQYIVNINFIQSIDQNGANGLLLIMKDGKEIDVSRRHTSTLRELMSL